MFTTPAFVYVPDAAARQALVAWCEARGYNASLTFCENRNIVAVNFPRGYVDILANAPERKGGGIDCHKNISLFKALAAMDDAQPLGQWYVTTAPDAPRVYAFARTAAAYEWICRAGTFRRCTAGEIRRYFHFVRQRRAKTQAAAAPEITMKNKPNNSIRPPMRPARGWGQSFL